MRYAAKFVAVLLAIVALCGCAIMESNRVPLSQQGRIIPITDLVDARGQQDKPGMRRSTRMPDMFVINDREWLIIYDEYSRPTSTGVWSRIVIKRTGDRGKTWSAQLINEQRKGEEGFLGNWNMSRISRLPDGRLVITSCTRWGKKGCYFFFSQDQGKTWTEPEYVNLDEVAKEKLGFGVSYVETSRVMAFDDGTLLLMAHRSIPKDKRPPKIVTDVFVSTDGGKSWQLRSTVSDVEHDICEPAILIQGQRVQIYCRDNRGKGSGMVVCRSEDEGFSWKKVYVADEAPGHQPGLAVLNDGRVLLIYRVSDPNRVGADIWVHDPETFQGNTYELHRVIDSDHIFDVDSGAVAQLSDGTVLLCYATIMKQDNTRWPDKRIRLHVLPTGTFKKTQN